MRSKRPKIATFPKLVLVKAWGLNFHRANAVKYIARAGKKAKETEAEDIRKAIWYLERDLGRMEKKP